jgi:hypothetical protein
MRYYYKNTDNARWSFQTNLNGNPDWETMVYFPVIMRTTPTISRTSVVDDNGTSTVINEGIHFFRLSFNNSTASAIARTQFETWVANARL